MVQRLPLGAGFLYAIIAATKLIAAKTWPGMELRVGAILA
jgi:hypothetical protein